MRLKLSEHSKNIIIACGFIFNLFALFIISHANRLAVNGFISFGKLNVPVSTFSGSIQTIALFICMITVCIKQRLALILSYCYYAISIILMLVSVFVLGSFSAVPGIFSVVLAVVTITIISRQFINIQREKVTDSITNLPNRVGADMELDRLIEKDLPFSVLMVQIVNYKSLTDDVGTKFGEEILRACADRLQTTVGNRGRVFKMDGAEFCVFANENVTESVARHVIGALSKKVTLVVDDIESNYYLDVRAGIAKCPLNTKNPTELMRFASVALFHAQTDNVNKYTFFNSDMQVEIKEYVDTIRKIKLALENDYFSLVYQPQFTSHDKKLRGFETLIRMNLPDGGNVPPGRFIDLAERTDLISQIDKFVLKRALTEFAPVFKKMNVDFILSINVSAKSMAEPTFYDDLRILLTKIGFPASNLEIEITEYSLGAENSYAEENIKSLKALGVKFALDDFGTGYTSLSRLMNLKVDLVKIDKSLIDNILTNDENRALVDSVIYMGHIMKCEVIAEGVEDEHQLNAIKECKCDLVQGYIWGRPKPFEDAMTIIKAEAV